MATDDRPPSSDACAGTKAFDPTTPARRRPTLRFLEKRAVRDGGGKNHRMSLSDDGDDQGQPHRGRPARSRTRSRIVRAKVRAGILIEVEVETVEGSFRKPSATDCDIIMLDNMATPT
ncbi:MAG: hypothetical protein MZU97_11820 [Bacillus subtilis]|nr:hypothetical protein [Bacillus subtilis]